MTAGDDDLRAADAVFDCDHVRAETIADIVILHDDALALRHDRFKFAQIEDDVRPVETSHGSTDDLARAILKLLVNHFLFGLANSLHHRLLRRLCRDTPEILRCDFYFHNVAYVYVRLDPARFRQLDLVL